MNDLLLEPLKYYDLQAKNKIIENSEEYFQNLLDKSGVNIEENRSTVKKYRTEDANAKKLSKKNSSYKALRVLLILLSAVGVIFAVVGISQIASSDAAQGAIFLSAGAFLAILCLVLCFKVLNKKIKNLDMLIEKHRKKADEYMKTAKAQMAPLNALFDNTDTFKVIEKTMPEIKFDPIYSNEIEKSLIEKYDFVSVAKNRNISVTDVLSGKLLSNPFLFYRYKMHSLGTCTYTGSLVIHWTETYTDSDGKVRTRTRTQTLMASVCKPKPYYSTHTALGFGAQAAPDLSFERYPTHAERLEEKALERKVNSGAKKLAKKARKATSTGNSFQEMANSEFDVLFGATNRDNEVQFRLMYTPLAQQNTTNLIKSNIGYGDDFCFRKQRRFNIISSEHSNYWDMDTSSSNYLSYDVDEAKRKFVNFNSQYFKSIYFDFAPLMSVPAYMEEPSFSMEKYTFPSNYTEYEHEILANAIGAGTFAHKDSSTDAILKTELEQKSGDADILNVTSYSYAAFDRVDVIPTLGGDGRIHGVPVPWIEYIPIENTAQMSMKNLNLSEKEFENSDTAKNLRGDWAFHHGILAEII